MAHDLTDPGRAHYPPGHRKDQYMESFYRGLKEAQRILREKEVDAVILPLRGAEIIGRGLSILYELDAGGRPEFIYLNIGEVDKKGARKMPEASIKGEITRGLGASHAIWRENPKFAIVDEALSGGSISLNINRVRKALEAVNPKASVIGVAIKQERVKTPLAPLYLEKVAAGEITQVGVKMLFFTDDESLLHTLSLNGSGKPHVKAGGEMFKRLDVYTDLQLRHRGIRQKRDCDTV